jgi:23S rRNA pseudouridine2457 synthase
VPRLIALNKPFGVICQFSRDGDRPTLADFVRIKEVYPAGRLDTDSEGLLLLTDSGPWQARISQPRHKLPKTYQVQVEGVPDDAALARLAAGVALNDGRTLPCAVRRIDEPDWLWPRDPPIRARAAIPTSWIELVITEGRNRQVRRMTAAVGHPTLRLIRVAVGPWSLDGLRPGEWREVDGAVLGAGGVAREPKPVAKRSGARPGGPRSDTPRPHGSKPTGSRSTGAKPDAARRERHGGKATATSARKPGGKR